MGCSVKKGMEKKDVTSENMGESVTPHAQMTTPDEWTHLATVTRSPRVAAHKSRGELQTFHVGQGGSPLQLRIYDKTQEIKRSNKQWLKAIWGQELDSDVWRIEYQIRRPVLREFKVNTLNDGMMRLAGLWVYLTTSWFSLREHDDCHTTRRSVIPFWQDVQKIGESLPGIIHVSRSNMSESAAIGHILKQMLGYTKTSAAHIGESQTPDVIQQMENDYVVITTQSEFEEAVQERAIKLGLDLEEDVAG